ncbi:Zinc finger HIT domain-containing protein 3 [Euphorbia peplus]|nr:Zinc finger HIT domain-containing protein 3 [Euphorbia peplus]
MGGKQCQVCEEAEFKYKCPSCLLPYCSLGCFKKHKETPCVKPVPNTHEKPVGTISVSNLSVANPELPVKRPLTVDATTQILQEPQLQAIACCNEIRNALSDERIRNLISSIDSAADPESVSVLSFHLTGTFMVLVLRPVLNYGQELDKAMEVEAFRLFTDKILSSVGK